MKRKKIFIAGIYNYCDRWCERCAFTTRCRNFESTDKLSREQLDIGNEAFWKSIGDNFRKASKLLHKAAAKFGIDLSNIPEEEMVAIGEKRKMKKESAKQHPLGVLTMDYIKEAKTLLNNNSMLIEKREAMVQLMEMGLQNGKETVQDALTIKDCVEVIYWYLYFIHVKFQRALQGLLENYHWEEANDYQRDCDGSAKIAMIAAQRSLEAWIGINELIPGYENDIIPLLAKLQQIIRMGNEVFPKASAFIRPGFDEQESN